MRPMRRPTILAALVLTGLVASARGHDVPGDEAHNGIDERIAELSATLAKNPDDFDALRERGQLYFSLNEFEFSSQDMERILRLKPGYGGAAVLRGASRYWLGDYKGALEDLRSGPARSADTPGAPFYTPEGPRCLGDHKGALAGLRKPTAHPARLPKPS